MSEVASKYLPVVATMARRHGLHTLLDDVDAESAGWPMPLSSGTMAVFSPFDLWVKQPALADRLRRYLITYATTQIIDESVESMFTTAASSGATMSAMNLAENDGLDYPPGGISTVKVRPSVIFETKLDVRMSETPRWKPKVFVDDSLR